jgi:hypothetical protein
MSGPLEIKVGPFRLAGAPGEPVVLYVNGYEQPLTAFAVRDVPALAEALLAFVVQPPAPPTDARRPQAVECRSCGALMFWAETPAGRRMPVNAEPDPAGDFVMTLHRDTTGRPELHVDRWRTDEPLHQQRNRWTSHFATCAQAAQHRRKP